MDKDRIKMVMLTTVEQIDAQSWLFKDYQRSKYSFKILEDTCTYIASCKKYIHVYDQSMLN